MDSLGFWNVRGLNSQLKHGDVRWMLHQHSLGLFGLLETCVKASNFHKVFLKVCDSWSVVTITNLIRVVELLVWLPNKFHVNIFEVGDQYIHTEVGHRATDKKKFHCCLWCK